ncbi:conoCAP-like [Gigantopelta aegis]|uniref:conoCAP-like n=1 Tax=Gigantopelta aegis TaxID=1735272 RepID=UPI001B888DD8|nr:conoCAP-like [Gigantopelta aegis]
MSTGHLLCLLLVPLSAITSADDIDDDYVIQSKTAMNNELDRLVQDKSDIRQLSNPLQVSPIFLKMLDRMQEDTKSGDVINKRVFCNGFTGCGGRFRARRRQQQHQQQHPPILKRPFCNHYFGCGNVKRSGLEAGAVDSVLVKPVNEPKLQTALRKRLFCNGYNGCQGKKRALYSNWLQKMEGIADNL